MRSVMRESERKVAFICPYDLLLSFNSTFIPLAHLDNCPRKMLHHQFDLTRFNNIRGANNHKFNILFAGLLIFPTTFDLGLRAVLRTLSENLTERGNARNKVLVHVYRPPTEEVKGGLGLSASPFVMWLSNFLAYLRDFEVLNRNKASNR